MAVLYIVAGDRANAEKQFQEGEFPEMPRHRAYKHAKLTVRRDEQIHM